MDRTKLTAEQRAEIERIEDVAFATARAGIRRMPTGDEGLGEGEATAGRGAVFVVPRELGFVATEHRESCGSHLVPGLFVVAAVEDERLRDVVRRLDEGTHEVLRRLPRPNGGGLVGELLRGVGGGLVVRGRANRHRR